MRIPRATLAIAAVLAFGAIGHAEVVTALTTSNTLVRFDSATPGTLIGATIPITGLLPGEVLQGIDFRPADGQLIGVAYISSTGAINVYAINQTTGAVQFANFNSNSVPAGIGRLSIDFNPVANALRIVGSNGGNFRIPAGGSGVLATDTTLNPGSPVVTGIAYDRNFAGATQTTLFDIDSAANALTTQGGINGSPSPNLGTLNVVGGLSGIAGSAVTGFDISGVSGVGYLSNSAGLFTLNLGTGAASSVGNIGSGALGIFDITAAPVPEPGSLTLLVVTAAGLSRVMRRKHLGAE